MRAGEGLQASTTAPPTPDSPLPTPDLNTIVRAAVRLHPIDAADSLGLPLTDFLAILDRPQVRAAIDTFREFEADHAARQRQAAQALAMQALSEILTKRNEPDANPVEVRRAASALSRLTTGRTPGLSGAWAAKPRVPRLPQAEPGITWDGKKWVDTSQHDEPDDEIENAPVSDEAKALIATGTVTRVLEKLQALDTPTPEAALAAIQGDLIKHRNRFDWIADFQHSRFLTYRRLPRTLDHARLHWNAAFVRVRYRGHEDEETWIKLWNDEGRYLIQTFRPDSS